MKTKTITYRKKEKREIYVLPLEKEILCISHKKNYKTGKWDVDHKKHIPFVDHKGALTFFKNIKRRFRYKRLEV